MTLPDLTGKATLDTADFRQGIARIKTDLTQLAALANKANTLKITASLSGQSAISADLNKLRATTAKPLVVPVSVQGGAFKNVTSEASALNAAIRELGGQVRATRNIWQAQIITDDQAAASSRRLRNELLALASAEGASADAVTKATTAAAQAQRTLDQASGRVSKGGFAFNASLGIIDALSSLGGPAGLAASQVGRFIVDGLKQALDKGKPEVRAEGDEVAQEVVNALKEKLKIQSPSLVTQEVGSFIMAGLVIGIKANTKEVLDAVGGVGAQIPETFKEASLGGDTGNLGESLGEGVISGLDGVLSEIPNLFQKVFGDAAPIAAQAAGDVADEVEINIAPALESLGSGFEKASEKLKEFPAAANGSAEASRVLGAEADASGKKIADQGVALGDVAGQADASSAALGDTSAATEEAGNGFEQLAGYLALAAVGVGIFVSAIAIVVPKAAEFQSALANIGTESDLTEQQLTDLGTGLLKTSARVGQSAQDLAKAAYDVVGAGVKGADTIAKLNGLTELSAKAASAGLTEVGTSADVITSALNAYGLSVDNAQHVSDVFFKTTATGKISFDQIASSMGAVFPIAATLGVSLEELTAGVAALTSSGVPASQAVTGIQAALSNVLKPSSQASELAGQLGIKFNSQALQAKGLAGFLADVTKATGGNVEQMGQLFGSVEAVNAVFALTNSQGAPRFKAALEGIRNSAGATDEAFAKQAQTFQFAQKQYTAAGEALQIEFGLRVLPTLTKLTKAAADVLANLDKIGENGLVQFVAITGGATLAAGAVLKISSAIKAATTATALFQAITAAGGWNQYVASLGGMAAGLRGVAGAGLLASVAVAPLAVIALAVGTAFAAWKVGEWIGNLKLFGDATTTVNDKLQDFFATALFGADPKLIKQMRDEEEAQQAKAGAVDDSTDALLKNAEAERAAADATQKANAERQAELQLINEQRTALNDLIKTLGERTLKLQISGQTQLQQELSAIGTALDDLREKFKKPFYINGQLDTGNAKLQAGLKVLDAQALAEQASARKKYADEAVKLSRDSALAAQKAEIDAMQDGAAKKAALRQLEVDAVNKETTDKVKSLGDFPKRQAEVESSGRRQVAALRSKWAQDDLTLTEQNGQKIAEAEKLGRDASLAALEDGRTKTQLIRRAALSDLEADIAKRVEALKGYPTAQGKIEAEGRKQVAALQASYLREDLATTRQNAEAVSEAQRTARDATLASLSEGLTKEKLLRAAALSDLQADIAKRVEALKGYPVAQAKIETEGRKQIAALQAGWRREDVQKGKENAQAVADAQKSARDATIGALADGQGKERLLRNAALSDLQADIAKRVDALKGYPAKQKAIESAGQQEIAALRAGWVEQDRKAREEAQKGVLDATRSSRDAAVANVQDQAARRQLSRENELSDLQFSLAERVAALKRFPELQRQIEEQGARDLQNLREKHRQEDEADAKARTARILKGWQDANAAVQAAQLAGLDEQSAAYELGLARQLEAVKGNALATAQLESQAIEDRSRLTEQKAGEQARQERARLDSKLATDLAAEGLSAQERLALQRQYGADVDALESKTHTDSLQRIAQREAAEIASAEKIRLARVALASQPIEEAGNNIAALGRQQQLAESTAQKLALEAQMVAAYQQQGAAIAGVLADADQLKLTDAERKNLGDKLTESAQNVALGSKQILEYQKQITGEAQEIVTLYGKMVTLTGSESGVALAQRELAEATADVGDAFRKASPYLEQFRNQRLKPDDFDPAKTALTGLISALEAQRQKLEALRGEYTKQRDALASIQDVLKGFGVELGDQGLLNNAIGFNQQTYDRAVEALKTLKESGSTDIAAQAEAVRGLRSSYDGLKDSLLALGEAQAKGFEGERDRIQKEGDARKKVLDAQIAAQQTRGADTRQLEAERDRLVNGTEQQVAALEAKAAAARKAAQDAFSERTKGIQELLSGVQQGAVSAGKAVDTLGQQVKTNEQQVKDSAARMKTSLQGAFSGLSTQAGQEGRRAGEQFVRQLQAQLKTLKLPSLTGNAGTLTLPSTKAATTYNTITITMNGQNITGTSDPNIKNLLGQLANLADAECRRRGK